MEKENPSLSVVISGQNLGVANTGHTHALMDTLFSLEVFHTIHTFVCMLSIHQPTILQNTGPPDTPDHCKFWHVSVKLSYLPSVQVEESPRSSR